MSGYESWGEVAAEQGSWENRKSKRAEPRKRKHKKEDREWPDFDTFQRYKRLQEEGSE